MFVCVCGQVNLPDKNIHRYETYRCQTCQENKKTLFFLFGVSVSDFSEADTHTPLCVISAHCDYSLKLKQRLLKT